MPSFMRPSAGQTDALMRIVTGVLFRWHCTLRRFSLPISPPRSFVIACPRPLISRTLVLGGCFIRSAACLWGELRAPASWMAPNTHALRPVRKMGNPLCRREVCLDTARLMAPACEA